MRILGLEPGAQVIILQGLSTYAALASAYFFARPVLRGQAVESHREILSELKPQDADVAALVGEASRILDQRNAQNRTRARGDNKRGVFFLIVSVLLLTGAVLIQVNTDPLFGHVAAGHD
jgi:hypothetical protein